MPKEVNIPIRVVEDTYNRLATALNDVPVFIGGRAVNILCSKNSRPTKDMDLVIKSNPEKRVNEIINNGFLIDRSSQNLITTLRSIEYDIKIDLYYSRPVNGISINKIIENSMYVKLKHENVRVVTPPILIIMKIDAGREQDAIDVNTLLQTYYRSDFEDFLKKERRLIENLGIDEQQLKNSYYLKIARRR